MSRSHLRLPLFLIIAVLSIISICKHSASHYATFSDPCTRCTEWPFPDRDVLNQTLVFDVSDKRHQRLNSTVTDMDGEKLLEELNVQDPAEQIMSKNLTLEHGILKDQSWNNFSKEFQALNTTNFTSNVSNIQDENVTQLIQSVSLKNDEILNETLSVVKSDDDVGETFVGSPGSTLITIGECQCDLVSLDCLSAIPCLQLEDVRRKFDGIVVRSIIKRLSSKGQELENGMQDSPIGKSSQYALITVWEGWLKSRTIPVGLVNIPEAFVNHSNYPYCRENDIKGRRCFFHDFHSDETLDQSEKSVVTKFQHLRAEVEQNATMKVESFQGNPFNATVLDYLLFFSHLARITLNMRQHVHAIHANRTVTKRGGKANIRGKVLRVSMHVRRGDACNHKTTDYEFSASPLNSPAQVGALRVCYETSVYMSALERVMSYFPDRNIVVYLSTDHSQSLMDEIKSSFKTLYESVTWKYLKYPQHIFDYFEGKADDGSFIESTDNKYRGILGETAVADLLHLSFGEVFIGHLGSRFGKLGWFLATARYNSFIPYFSVDGHSVCCDIDEACGENAQYVVSMENCLGKFWPGTSYARNLDLDVYFTSGAYFRKAAARDEMSFRMKKGLI